RHPFAPDRRKTAAAPGRAVIDGNGVNDMGMGAPSGGGSGGGRGGRRRGGHRGGAISEINVTPLVDVMLVLLIIFMVAAPMMTVGVPVDLPETQAKALNSETQPITISVKND